MDNANALDSLVRIASMGTAGVCVLIVFIAGFLIWKLSDTASKEKIHLIKFYLKTCLVIAVISFASGLANFIMKQDHVDSALKETKAVISENNEIKKVVADELPKIEKAQMDILEAKEIINSDPTPSRSERIEAEAQLDTANKSVKNIDMIKLRRIIKPRINVNELKLR